MPFGFVSFRFSSRLEPCRFVSFRFHFKKISSPLFRFVSHLQNTQLFMSLFRFFKKNGFDPYSSWKALEILIDLNQMFTEKVLLDHKLCSIVDSSVIVL